MSTSISSPFSHLVNGYDIPSPTQRDAILSFVHSKQSELDSANSEYEQLTRRCEELKGKITSLTSVIRTHNAVVSALRRIPAEIWCKIFMDVVLFFSHDSRSIRHKKGDGRIYLTMEAPWNIAGVCGQWRDIAMGYPALWSYISIRLSRSGIFHAAPPNDYLSFIDLLREQLRRSSTANLHVCVHPNFIPPGKESKILQTLLSPHIHRIQYLASPSKVIANLKGSFPQLRFVAIDRMNPNDVAEALNHSGNLNLRHIRLGNFDCRFYAYALPWKRLRTVEISFSQLYSTDWDTFLTQALSQLSGNLVHFTLHVGQFRLIPDEPIDGDSITLPKLRSLSLSGHPAVHHKLLPYIVTPSLKAFRHHPTFYWPDHEGLRLNDFIGLIIRSRIAGGQLTTVALKGVMASKKPKTSLSETSESTRPVFPIMVRILVALEGLCSGLRELSVEGHEGAFTFDDVEPDRSLDLPETDPCFFQSLEKLCLGHRRVDPNAFLDFIERVGCGGSHASNHTARRLKTLKLENMKCLDEGGEDVLVWTRDDVRDRLETLKDKGLTIRILDDNQGKETLQRNTIGHPFDSAAFTSEFPTLNLLLDR